MSKRKTNIKYRSSEVRDYDGELEAAMYRKAFSILAQREYEQAEAQPADEAEQRALAELDERMDGIITRGLHQNRRSIWTRRIRRAANVAACVIAILGIGLGVAIATPSLRQQLYRISALDCEIFTEVRLTPNEEFEMDVPEGWAGDYYMAYIPEGYEFYYMYDGIAEVIYLRSEEEYLRFSEYRASSTTLLDTENANVSYGTVHDCEAMIIEKNGRVTVAWTEADKLFLVELYGDVETALNIAKNVSIINENE